MPQSLFTMAGHEYPSFAFIKKINPAAAGATAVLFLGEPTISAAKKMNRKFVKHQPTQSWIATLLDGMGIGFGGGVIVSAVSTSIALLPAAAIGAGAGAALWAVGRAVKAGVGAAHRWLQKRSAKYAKATATVARTLHRPVAYAKVTLTTAASFVGFSGRYLELLKTAAILIPGNAFLGRFRVNSLAIISAMLANPKYGVPAVAMPVTAVMALADYSRRAGTFPVPVSALNTVLFTLGSVAVVATAQAIIEITKWRMSHPETETVESETVEEEPTADEIAMYAARVEAARQEALTEQRRANAAKARRVKAEKDAEAAEQVAEQVAETVDAQSEEGASAQSDAEPVADPEPQPTAKVDKEAMEEISKRLSGKGTDPVITPTVDRSAPVRMGGGDAYSQAMARNDLPSVEELVESQAPEALADAVAVATGKPLPRKPRGRVKKDRSGESELVHSTFSSVGEKK